MKVTRSVLVALALLSLLAVPALGQGSGVSGTIAVDCDANPETVTVQNTGQQEFTVQSLTSLDDPREDEPFGLSVVLEPGSSVTFFAGAEQTGDLNYLTEQFIFDNDAPDEGVRVEISHGGGTVQPTVDCDAGSGAFVGVHTDMPDTGAGGMTAGGLPLANIVAVSALLVGAGYGMLRRR